MRLCFVDRPTVVRGVHAALWRGVTGPPPTDTSRPRPGPPLTDQQAHFARPPGLQRAVWHRFAKPAKVAQHLWGREHTHAALRVDGLQPGASAGCKPHNPTCRPQPVR